MFVAIAATLALVSFVLTLWQWLEATRFPLHERVVGAAFAPAVTLLKPLKGCDSETEACLRSWFQQEYPSPIQILFGVASDADPVCDLVRRLMAQFPKADAELVICPRQLGLNAKASTLAHLQPRAKHGTLVVSDADVLAPADLLVNVVAPLARPGVGLVNCLYRFGSARTAAMRWEAVAVNADFWSQVLQARTLKPLDFALGAVMATTGATLQKAGGFRALCEYLADDYQLGSRIAELGLEIVLCPVVVECRSAPMGWAAVWTHQLRWARTTRACEPGPFFLSIVSNGTFWPLLWVALEPAALPFAVASFFWAVRIATALSNQSRLTREGPTLAGALMVPLKDLSGVAIWALAFGGSEVVWRGQRFRMLQDGRLAEGS
ncbi:MAG: glycosyltransferase [Verrucomicrobiia bacterium]